MLNILTKILAEGKGIVVRRCLKEAGAQRYEPELVLSLSKETEMAYKAQSPGKVAPFDSAQGALSILPNGHDIPKPRVQETCLPQAGRVVARGDQECCGCVAKVHVLIRGDLSDGAAIISMGVGLRTISKGVELPPNPTAMKAAHHVAQHMV